MAPLYKKPMHLRCVSMRKGHPINCVSGTATPVHLDCTVCSRSIQFRVGRQPFREVRCALEPCVRCASPGNRFAHPRKSRFREIVFSHLTGRTFGFSSRVTVRGVGRTSIRTVDVIDSFVSSTVGIVVRSSRLYRWWCCAFFPFDCRCRRRLFGVTVGGVGRFILV